MKDATKLKILLEEYGVKQCFFAEKLGMSVQNLTQIFKNDSIPKKQLLPTALFLQRYKKDATVDWLLEDNDKEY